jgi:drug/metabolite transporter (DMT)-like permease
VKRGALGAPRRAEAALIANTIIWGSTFVLVKQALRDVSPVLFLALRFTLAAAVLLVLFRGSWSHPRNPRWSLTGGALAGTFLFSGYAFQTIGLQFTTAPKSAFLTGLTSVMTPLLGAVVYRKKPRAVEVGGVLLATCGMALMTLPGATLAMNRGDLLTVCCAACYAAHILTLNRYSATASFELLATAQIGISALLALSLFRGMETP